MDGGCPGLTLLSSHYLTTGHLQHSALAKGWSSPFGVQRLLAYRHLNPLSPPSGCLLSLLAKEQVSIIGEDNLRHQVLAKILWQTESCSYGFSFSIEKLWYLEAISQSYTSLKYEHVGWGCPDSDSRGYLTTWAAQQLLQTFKGFFAVRLRRK